MDALAQAERVNSPFLCLLALNRLENAHAILFLPRDKTNPEIMFYQLPGLSLAVELTHKINHLCI